MTSSGWYQIIFFLLVIFAITKPMGVFLTRVFNRDKTFLDFALRPIERLIYRLCGVHEEQEMQWIEYGTAMLLFSGVSMALLYFIERLQLWLGFNPQKLANVGPDLAWNTAASFTTNTNWQAYVPETTMSYFTQMAGLAYHNFASAAVGIALAIAVIRGVARRESKTIGNFWVDLTRCFLWVLLPACLIISLVFVSQGVVQNLKPYASAQLIDPQTVQTQGTDGKTTTQTVTQQPIALGPTASQEAIKMFGTNGGGFFNANSAHPFENPTALSGMGQMLLIFLVGPYTPLGELLNATPWHLSATNTFLALVIAEVYESAPYYIVGAQAAFADVDPRMEEQAALLGDRPRRVFRRVTLPLAAPGLGVALSVAWARAMGAFGAVIIIAYHPYGLPLQIYVTLQETGLASALPYALVLLVVALPLPLAAFTWSARARRRRRG